MTTHSNDRQPAPTKDPRRCRQPAISFTAATWSELRLLSKLNEKSRRTARWICWSLSILAATSGLARAQGSLSDYQRAEGFHARFQNKVVGPRMDVHWIDQGQKLWTRSPTGKDSHRYVLVDTNDGMLIDAFDHNRLAKALKKATDNEARADRLPIEGVVMDGRKRLSFWSRGKVWECNLNDYELQEIAARNDNRRTTVKVLGRAKASDRTGVETRIDFVNQTDRTVSLFWVDNRGERRLYEEISAGGRHSQHTYEGHVWLATDEHGELLGAFEAGAEHGVAVIDGARKPAAQAKSDRPNQSSRLSPDGRWRVKIIDHNVVLRDRDSGDERKLSSNGSPENGYQRGFFWSPDSKRLVVLRSELSKERTVHYVESTPEDQLQPKLHAFSYRKPGDPLPKRRPVLFDVAGDKAIEIDDELFSNPYNLNRFRWDEGSQHFTFLYNQRGHQSLRLIAVDAKTGKAHAVIDEESATFICYSSKTFLRRLDETAEVIWMSERDGWNHLYLYDAASGQVANQITKGQWAVRGVDRVDAERRQIWFRAGGIRPEQDPYFVHHCRINFDGSGLVVLTEGDGTHEVEYAPDGEHFIDRYSRVDLPPVTELRRSSDGSLVCVLHQADWSELLAAGWQRPLRFVAKGRDAQTDIYGVILRPSDFDSQKRYPVVEYIYAGPQSAYVPKRFAVQHSGQSLAELGFVVVCIDGMGTSHRSKAFHDVCWKNLADAGFPDRIAWIRAAAREYPWIDASRVGIYGGSAGGQNAMRAVLDHGGFYSAAAADCGCHDNRMDKMWWNEQWMGWPVDSHYEESSNAAHADRLNGELLLTVGEMDENVDPASTMQVVDALIRADKDFELVVFPGRGHGAGDSDYGVRRRRDFFVRNLLGVEPRWE